MTTFVYVDMARVRKGEEGIVLRPEGTSRHEVTYARRVDMAPGVAIVQLDEQDADDGTFVRIEWED